MKLISASPFLLFPLVPVILSNWTGNVIKNDFQITDKYPCKTSYEK